jgi:hypothetical protein
VESCDQRALTALRWHWGSAYIISRLAPGTWIAQRRDTRQTLRADHPEKLRQQIRADYFARPVPRGPRGG